jgi:hypothetical protein
MPVATLTNFLASCPSGQGTFTAKYILCSPLGATAENPCADELTGHCG